jgi:uncharacterized protein
VSDLGPMADAEILEDTVVPAGAPWGRKVAAGEHLRFVDLEGKQAIDLLCYSAADPLDRYNAANTMKLNGNIFIGKGSSLWSLRANKMMTVVEDTCGRHDTIGGCCSAEINELRYHQKNTPSCQENFRKALEPFGLSERDVVANVNLFMNVPVTEGGEMAIVDGVSKPGDHVDLRAEMDLIVVISNCPQVNNPASGYNPTPIRVIAYRPH